MDTLYQVMEGDPDVALAEGVYHHPDTAEPGEEGLRDLVVEYLAEHTPEHTVVLQRPQAIASMVEERDHDWHQLVEQARTLMRQMMMAANPPSEIAESPEFQELMDQLLGVDGEEEFTVYLAPVGKV